MLQIVLSIDRGPIRPVFPGNRVSPGQENRKIASNYWGSLKVYSVERR